ncbi:hypothetical protein RAA17_15555 [Komagataeibacter rhaeticus]|nr:hypothetical protein [Komagataeibacter rhaeticus]
MHDNATPEHLERLFALAEKFGCGLDLHVDENNVRGGTALQAVAEMVMRRRFSLPVLCGHCCSLSVQDAPRQKEIVQSVADAGMGIVSLPMCNLYLQDRQPGRTPLWRGVSMVHELHAAGCRSCSPATTRATRSMPMATWTWRKSFHRPCASRILTIRLAGGGSRFRSPRTLDGAGHDAAGRQPC